MSVSLLLNAWAFHDASYQIDEKLYAASALETQQMITPLLSESFRQKRLSARRLRRRVLPITSINGFKKD